MDRMPKPIDRTIRLDRRRGAALLRFVQGLAAGDDRAASFLDALAEGAYDDAPPSAGDSGLRLFVRPKLENPQ
jgi:hypothetical protein